MRKFGFLEHFCKMLATLIICRLFCVPISLDGGPLHFPIIQAANTITPDKETMQLYLIKDTINTTTPVITHSEYNSTFLYIIFSTESSVAFVTRFTWDFSSPSSLLVLQCWLLVWCFVSFSFFCYCYGIADCNLWLIFPHCRPLVDLNRTHSGEISFCCSNPYILVIVLIIPDNCRRRGRRRQCKFFWPV